MRLSVTCRAALAASAVAVLVVLAPVRPAWAHAQLLSTDPADGTTVAAPPAAVTLTFNEQVKQQFSTVVVTGADGVSRSDGPPRSVDRALTQAVKPLPAGVVRVAWRTVSADGHPIEGQFTFTNAAPAATVAVPSSAQPAPTAGAPSVVADPVSQDSGGVAGLLWAAGGAAVVVAVLVGGVGWWRRRGSGTG